MDLTVRIADAIEGVNPADWNALDHGASPFLEWGFLRALERSKSIGGESGWMPLFITAVGVADDGGESKVLGAVAAFIKDHSYGEYIFDWSWAQASEQAGLRYYPKLVVAAPVTPATGRRILLHPDLDEDLRQAVAKALIDVVGELAKEARCSGVHWLFTTTEENELLAACGYHARSSMQFHWHNRGYATFDDFLAGLTSRKRKQFRKERRKALAAVDGLTFVPGAELSPEQVDAMDRYYRHTTDNHWGRAYLEAGFFHALVEELPERVLFADVRRDREPVAGALFLETDKALYGRYWGCTENIDCLHFETAYYAGIERAIQQGLPLFEAGAQGEHKLLRGFEPVCCHSAHKIHHPGLDAAIRRFLRQERMEVARRIEAYAEHLPYRLSDDKAAE